MRNRTIPIALLIAASLTPVAGCSDHSDSSGDAKANDSIGNALAAEQDNRQTDNDSPLPVNDPNPKQADATSPSSSPGQDKRYKQLQQQIDGIKADDQQRLDQQSQRIGKLEDQVQRLTQRLRRLPQPAPADTQKTKPGNGPTPDAVSPQTDSPKDKSQSKSSASKSSTDDASDESSDDSEPGSDKKKSPPPATPSHAKQDVAAHCPSDETPSDQFDVFYQADGQQALNVAAGKIKSAGLSDWFARPSVDRVYVGRYGRCPLAARRSRDVHERTGLALNIAAVQPHRGHRASRQTSHHDYGSEQSTTSVSHATQASIVQAPFSVIGVEIRGTHHYLGVAPRGVYQLKDVTWLSSGDSYGGWTLREIRTDTGTAIFRHGSGSAAVALPGRG